MLDELEEFRYGEEGSLTLKLSWPARDDSKKMIWKQMSNPVTSSVGGVEGYEAIDCDFDDNHWFVKDLSHIRTNWN